MSTAEVERPVSTPTAEAPVGRGQCVVLRGIGWRGYTTLLKVRGTQTIPRIVYLDGDAWLMSPSYPHENVAERLGTFVTEVVVGLDIPCILSGSTTFRRRRKQGGAEGDKTFYLANEARVRGKKKISLRTDPPPDLAIEVVYSHEADAKLEVYRRLGVPEVWVYDDGELTIWALGENGRYAASTVGLALPFLSAREIADWVNRPQSGSDTDWVKALRRWIREELVPKVPRGGGGG
jgi:Uma2 family endonuclease